MKDIDLVRQTIFLALLLCPLARGVETVKTTLFTLKDGTEIHALRFATLEVDGVTKYTLTGIDGKKVKLTDEQIESRQESLLLMRDLPLAVRIEVEDQRKAAAAAAAAAEKAEPPPGMSDAERKALIVAKRRENDADLAVRKLAQELAQAEAARDHFQNVMRGYAGTIARVSAEHREAERDKENKELRRRLAGEKARLEAEERAAKEAADKAERRIKDLREDIRNAEKKLAEAKAETAKLIKPAKAQP